MIAKYSNASTSVFLSNQLPTAKAGNCSYRPGLCLSVCTVTSKSRVTFSIFLWLIISRELRISNVYQLFMQVCKNALYLKSEEFSIIRIILCKMLWERRQDICSWLYITLTTGLFNAWSCELDFTYAVGVLVMKAWTGYSDWLSLHPSQNKILQH